MDVIDYDYDDRPQVEDATLMEWEGELKDKPEIEQRLYKLQADWYSSTDDAVRQAAWIEMFNSVQLYARSMVLQKMKNKKFLSPDIIDDYATESALRFMSQYLYRRNFKCGTSFGKMINYKVLEAVYGNKEDDKTVSLNQETDDSSDLDLLSMSEKIGISQFMSKSEEDPSMMATKASFEDLVDEVFRELDLEIDDDLIRLKSRMFMNLVFKKPKNRHVKSQFIKNCCFSKKEIDVINLLELEVKTRLKKLVVLNTTN
jgi:hypothetical protein